MLRESSTLLQLLGLSEPGLTTSEALYEEQKRMFGNADGTFRDVEYEEVKNMPVMDSCIREALRLVSLLSFCLLRTHLASMFIP
jgi:hypothetical protein